MKIDRKAFNCGVDDILTFRPLRRLLRRFFKDVE